MKTTTLCGMLVSLTLTPWPVQAHDIYGNLVGTHGEFCCHGTDCRPAPWRYLDDVIYGGTSSSAIRAIRNESHLIGTWRGALFTYWEAQRDDFVHLGNLRLPPFGTKCVHRRYFGVRPGRLYRCHLIGS